MAAFSKPVLPPELTQHTTEFFTNASHAQIHGSTFNVYNATTPSSGKNGFEILQEHVATSAFHNSKKRRDPPRCHEHTREAVLDEIFEWILGNVGRETWIAWLNGAAGAGKSAICQSIAERCILHGILVASFFFFRTDPSRNTIDPLVATLAYQIIQLLPETKTHIVQAIESNPLVFEQSFEVQLNLLVVQPLCQLQVSDPAWTLLLIVDGVDECDEDKTQMGLIQTMAKLLRAKSVPLIVLFGSRRESQLLMAFKSRELVGILNPLPLDDNYKADEDIRRFLDDSFDEIKQTHPFSERLPPDWPSPDHVQEIVNKSSGQFIYASVVIKFLLSPSANPSIRLDIIRGLRPTGRLTPFAELDELYRHIFSHIEYLATTLELVAYFILADTDDLTKTAYFFELEENEVESMFVPLASVMLCNMEGEYVDFHHASLPDFLRDKARSGAYCINTLATPLSIRWFKTSESGRFRDLSEDDQNFDIPDLLQHSEPTAKLYECLVLYSPSQNNSAYYGLYNFGPKFLTAIENMDFGDDGKAYNKLLNDIVRYVHKKLPGTLSHISHKHDISKIMDQLASEEDTSIESEDKTDVFTSNPQASVLPTEVSITAFLPPTFTDIEDAPHPLPLSPHDNARLPGNISMAPYSPRIAGTHNLPSFQTLLLELSRPQKRAWSP